MKLFLVVMSFLFSHEVMADQPRSALAKSSFLNSKEVVQAATGLLGRGYRQGDVAATAIYGAVNDEGFDGLYLVSVYFERGDKPWDKHSETVVGLVSLSAGHLDYVKLLDPVKAVKALGSIQ